MEGEVGNTNGTNFDDLDLEAGSVVDKKDHEKKDPNETEDIRSLLQNCYVPLDNGKTGRVFSADYTRQEPRYTCYVCTARMHGVKEFNMHTTSQNHCTAMGQFEHPAKNFPIIFEDSETQIELGEPAPPGMEDEIQIKPCKIQAALDFFRTLPLIGLEYLIELTDGRDVKVYCCLLCEEKSDTQLRNSYFKPDQHLVIKHLTSHTHSLNYLELFFPRTHKTLEVLPQIECGTGILLNSVLKRIEGKFGRLKPRPFIYKDFLIGKEALRKSIQDGFHFKESPDDDFDKISKLNETPGYKSSGNQGGSKENDGGATFWLHMKKRKFGTKRGGNPCGLTANFFSPGAANSINTKINSPDEKQESGRPECSVTNDNKDDSNTEKGDRELDNLSPVSAGSIGSMRGSRSRSNSPPRGPLSVLYRGKSRSPDYRYRHRAANRSRSPIPRHRSRSRNRTRSPIRSRSRQRSRSRHRSRSGDRSSRTANRSVSGNRSRSPQQFRPRYIRFHKSRSRSRDRPNLPYRRKRSYSRSRSRSPRSFNRARNYKPPPRKSPDEVKSDIFKAELRILLDKLKYHEEFPEKHPQYSFEWKEFWNRRYKELQAAGKDPTQHDFKPEWISYWKERVLELHDQDAIALKERIYNPVEERKTENIKDVNDENNDDDNNDSRGPPGTRMGFVPFTDDSTKVISVLRLITVLESMLGVLAPKIVTLLAKALSMDKVRAGSSEDILYNEEDCVLLETVKEKLKGLFFAGLVERHLVNTTKFTIKNIEEVLSKAPRSFGKRTNPLLRATAPPKQVTLPGIGTVDRMAIAEQIATTLISQGRTDVSEQELESLIDAVVASTSEEQSAPPSTSQSQSQTQASGALTLLQSAYDEEDADIDRGDPHILSKTLPLIESVDIITNLSDYDLHILIKHFNRLQPLNQTKVINFLSAVEKISPSRFQRLQETTRVNLNMLSSQASHNVVMKGNDEMRPSQPPPLPYQQYTNSAWWPSH
ncbi:hypothetical protein LSTR_LSTR005593 [Laodelphax striatellus]|uniref:Uncharacterized protein n=1 Tax=Laodelphax striatellus TaxID=195883 RepID=A0A482WY35_LAOST|nr:hypothetical protein LSTR_LSTR005593 [Laodelphax striatellus]